MLVEDDGIKCADEGSRPKEDKCQNTTEEMRDSEDVSKEEEENNPEPSQSSVGKEEGAAEDKVTKIFRKSSQDGNLILFLPQRNFTVTESRVEPIVGIALVHQSLVSKNQKVFAQVILLFRYGREDEEMMGIRFCNEIVMASEQIHPVNKTSPEAKLMEFKISKTGFITVPIQLNINSSAPPSIRLHPCRPYSGSPIGTNYEVQVFASSGPDIVPKPRKMISMSVQVHEAVCKVQPSHPSSLSPNVSMEKHFLMSDKSLKLNISLNKNTYIQTDKIKIDVQLERSKGGHSVRRLKFSIVQQVDVAMFSNGSFKNYVGCLSVDELSPNQTSFSDTYEVDFLLQRDYSWLAIQENQLNKKDITRFAPSVVMVKNSIFAIKVHYYVLVTLNFGLLKKNIHLKLPFILKPTDSQAPSKPVEEHSQ